MVHLCPLPLPSMFRLPCCPSRSKSAESQYFGSRRSVADKCSFFPQYASKSSRTRRNDAAQDIPFDRSLRDPIGNRESTNTERWVYTFPQPGFLAMGAFPCVGETQLWLIRPTSCVVLHVSRTLPEIYRRDHYPIALPGVFCHGRNGGIGSARHTSWTNESARNHLFTADRRDGERTGIRLGAVFDGL